MSFAKQSLYFVIAALAWTAVGVLAGFTLALALGLSFRQATFFAALGLGIAWFGLSGFHGRKNAAVKPKDNTLTADVRPIAENKIKQRGASDVLSADDSREWIDQFLVRQQKK